MARKLLIFTPIFLVSPQAKRVLKNYGRNDPRYVALSPHDSCQLSIDSFKQTFGSAYQEIRTGVPLAVQ